MKGSIALSVALALALGPAAGRAADVSYSVYVDGRPLDAGTPSGLQHRGIAYVDVVRAVKTFDGLLTFAPGGVTRVSIGGRTLDFRNGRPSVRSGDARRRLPGAPFVENGVTYVPLATIAALASAKLSLDPVNHRYLLTSAPQRALPAPEPSALQTSALRRAQGDVGG
jgi:hypothetical protein